MSDKIVSILNDLIETSNNGEKGFSTAAEDTRNPELSSVFRQRAQDCARAAKDLQQMVVRLGGKPEEGGTVAGAAHRGWLNLKASVTGRSDVAILEECERGEDVAKAHYRKAVESDLPADIRSVVELQLEGAKNNHEQIRDLRDRYRAQNA
jgi:uncharacterized protein (TIGR02284 family)